MCVRARECELIYILYTIVYSICTIVVYGFYSVTKSQIVVDFMQMLLKTNTKKLSRRTHART